MNKKIGLALGGGAVLGAAHIGVLKAIKELSINIDYVSGTSIGSLIGAFYALGKEVEEIEEIAENLDWLNVTSLTISQLGLLSNKKIGEIIKENCENFNFNDVKKKFFVVAANIANGDKKIFEKGSICEAVEASTCIPGIFKPVEINNELFVDGGLVENVPISPLKKYGADIIIGVDLIKNKIYQKPKNIIELLTNTIAIMTNKAFDFYLKEADIMIYPKIGKYSFTETKNKQALIKHGYEAAMEELSKIV